ncbi:type I-E CRISPR-associated protein Cse2/CasB [Kitasatospora indigofera]|uniref:type I-E CRISPR-associated protein Cse2/CasB n=1 Tax=Kitasatospora indigofera TaxID=67307 RepID=UPI003689E865
MSETVSTTLPAPRSGDSTADTGAGTSGSPQSAPAGSLQKARAFTRWIDRRSFEDPGVRSALRRGRGRDLDAVPFMHRFVAGWLTEEQLRDPDVQRAYYTVASLIASQRRDQFAAAKSGAGTASESEGRYGRSLGAAFADGVAKGEAGLRESSAETRLNLLSRQSVAGLHRHLPGAVQQLRDKQVDVDWAQLLVDLSRWRRHCGAIKRRWLQDYYQARQADVYRRALDADSNTDVQPSPDNATPDPAAGS